MSNIRDIAWAYIKSMRVYLFFLSGMAGYAGVLWGGGAPAIDTALVLAVVFVGWGVNQVINDILGLEEDRINAPHRPLVTGDLPYKAAVGISAVLFVIGLGVTAWLNAQAIWLYLAVFGLNIVYQYAKGIPLLGNVVFGLLMPLTFFYGVQCAGGDVLSDSSYMAVALCFFLINVSMCFFTYYKDYEGDKTAGKRTLVVALGPEKARYLNFLFSLLPFIVLLVMPFEYDSYMAKFNFQGLMLLNFFLFQHMALAFFKLPKGREAYFNLESNYTTAVLYEVSFIMLVEPMIGVLLYLLSFVGVGGIFKLHKDHLS